MTVPVLTAVTDTAWEAGLVSAFDRGDLGIRVVRRCVDLADLLAAAASGTARVVIISADLRRLDREALSRLADVGVAVVGLVAATDETGLLRLRQLGVAQVVRADAGAEAIRDAATAAADTFAAQARPERVGDTAAGPAHLAAIGDRAHLAHRRPAHLADSPTPTAPTRPTRSAPSTSSGLAP